MILYISSERIMTFTLNILMTVVPEDGSWIVTEITYRMAQVHKELGRHGLSVKTVPMCFRPMTHFYHVTKLFITKQLGATKILGLQQYPLRRKEMCAGWGEERVLITCDTCVWER